MSLMGIYLGVITSYMHMGQFMLYLLKLWQVCLLLEITGESIGPISLDSEFVFSYHEG
jgi:hypothetical protein